MGARCLDGSPLTLPALGTRHAAALLTGVGPEGSRLALPAVSDAVVLVYVFADVVACGRWYTEGRWVSRAVLLCRRPRLVSEASA